MRRFGPLVLIPLLAASALVAESAQPAATTLDKVLADLLAEAQQSWRSRRGWPRQQPDYAQEHKVTLPSDVVLNSLGTQTHPDPLVDAWCKWQLLSFNPDLAKAEPARIGSIVNALPAIMLRPAPDLARARAGGAGGPKGAYSVQNQTIGTWQETIKGTDKARPVTEALSFGDGDPPTDLSSPMQPSSKAVQAWVLENHLLQRRKQLIDLLNIPALAYRNMVLDKLPAERGVKLAAMIEDLSGRIEAGDPSFRQAARRLCDQAVQQRDDPTLTPAVRKALADRVSQVHRQYTMVIDELRLDRRGREDHVQNAVRMDTEDLKTVLAALRGQGPRPR